MYRRASLFLALFLIYSPLGCFPQSADTQTLPDLLTVRPINRVIQPIDESQRIVLSGQTHPLARPENAIGGVLLQQRMERMVLVLRPSAEQETALEQLIQQQQTPDSPYYHQWLTPESFGEHFGIASGDLERVVVWLQAHGMAIDEIPASHRSVVFSGTAAQVEATFHTSMQRYFVGGETHFANASDPEIPQALAEVVRGVVSLHDFLSAPNSVVVPAYTYAGTHYLMPQDWDTIYDVTPLYNQGITGSEQAIAVLGRVDIALSDVQTFRSNAGLPANNPQIIVNGADPGSSNSGDGVESSLDVEWAGAVAKSASVTFVTSKSGASDGIALSAQYAVSHNVAPIVSLSYGLCEAAEGSGGNAFWNSLWQQAAAQGMSVFVSSGDSGAAGCDSSSASSATQGRGVNGLCSSPYSTCVGGTEFAEGSNPGQYWSASNSASGGSALSYIPETAWNESGSGGGLWASGGGVSVVYSKPSWQSAPGVPADGQRDVPDIAVSAAGHDAYIIQYQGSTLCVGGTSAAAPSLASTMALVLQQAGVAQGNLNPNLYALANLQFSGGASVFHDITTGNNSVPGVTGFSAGVGYDPVTGLGSIDANQLVNHWNNASMNFALTPSASVVTIAKGGSGNISLTLAASNGFNSAVKLSASGAPAGVTVKFSSATLTTSAAVTVTFTVPTTAAAGNSTLTITGIGGGLTRTTQFSLTVVTPTFTLTPSTASATAKPGTPATVTLTTTVVNGFKSSITLSASGLPTGVTAGFSPTSVASPGNGSSTLTLTVSSSAVSGNATVAIKATGGGVTQTQSLSLSVVVPSFILTANSTSANLAVGGATTFTMTTAGQNFNAAIALSVSELPKGVTGTFSPTSIASPGNGSSTLTLAAGSSASSGVSNLTVKATGGGVTQTKALSLTVTH